MNITITLTNRAAANLLAQAQLQGRTAAALLTEVVEARYGGAMGTVAGVRATEDDLYSEAMRDHLTDNPMPGRTYEIDESQIPSPSEVGFAVE